MLGSFPIDQDGRFEAQFVIPEDYGGVHDVIVTVDGRTGCAEWTRGYAEL